MELKDILSISGKPGLYKFISQGRNGIIVESLMDGKRMNANASMKISSMEDIAVFTDEGEEPLVNVFKKMIEKHEGGQSIDHKSGSHALEEYFAEVMPEYDRDRVYASDIKKIVSWYNLLTELNMINELIENQEKKEAAENSENEDNEAASSQEDDKEAANKPKKE